MFCIQILFSFLFFCDSVILSLFSAAVACLTVLLPHLSFIFVPTQSSPQLPNLPRLCQWALGGPHALTHIFHHRLGDHRDGRRAPERDVRFNRRRGVRGRHQLGRRHRRGLRHLQRWPGPVLRPLPLVHPGGKVGDQQCWPHITCTQAGTVIWDGCWLGLMLAAQSDKAKQAVGN